MPTAGRLAFSSNRHAGGVAVNVESVESLEDRNYRVISFAEYGDSTPPGRSFAPAQFVEIEGGAGTG